MIVLSKIIYFFISPLTWLIGCITFSLIAKKAKSKNTFQIFALLIAILFSNTVIYDKAVSYWVIPSIKSTEIQHYHVGIVLGGMSDYNSSTDRLVLQRSGDRIWQTLDLYFNHKIDKILITGGSGFVQNTGLDEANQFKKLLLSWGIPEKDLIIESKSRNTVENAQYTKKALEQADMLGESFLLITSAVHMKRAKKIFEDQGIKVTPFSTDDELLKGNNYFWNDYIVPDINTFNDWFRFIKEIVGYYSYLLMK
ncbi:MAG: YdcF family protein [Chitinophagales bacterium]|nr:YdcF family protein [Chitinophagales bacterium]